MGSMMIKDNTQLEKELLKIVEHKTLEEHTAVELIMNLFSSEVRSVLDRVMYAYKNPVEGLGYLDMGHVIEAEKAKYE